MGGGGKGGGRWGVCQVHDFHFRDGFRLGTMLLVAFWVALGEKAVA